MGGRVWEFGALFRGTQPDRRSAERCDVALDECPRPVVVDRKEDDVALANDLPDIGLVAGLVDRLTCDPGVACDPGQGLGLVRAHVTPRAVARGGRA